MNHNISAVIPFCSYDKHFFDACVSNLLLIGIEVVVVTYDHLYMGEPENMEVLQECTSKYIDNPNFKWVHLNWFSGKPSIFWEALARRVGTKRTKVTTEYILYVDIDEIIDPVPTLTWLNKGIYKRYTGIKLRCHMYQIQPTYQLIIKYYNSVMCKKDYALGLGFREEARLQFVNNNNRISRWASKLGINPYFYFYSKEPFIHHYTGARTFQMMLKKVENWSHNRDKPNWPELLYKTFKVENGKIGGNRFKIVENKFNIKY